MTLRSHPHVKVHEEVRLHRGRRIDLVLQKLELPSGLRLEVELVEHPGAVAVAACDGLGRLLVVRQYRPAVGDWTWEIPAGALEPGEDPALAARRELEEETGQRADRLLPLHVFLPAPGFASEVMHLFRAEGVSAIPGGGARCDEDEELEVAWVAPEALLAMQPLDAKTMIAALLVQVSATRS